MSSYAVNTIPVAAAIYAAQVAFASSAAASTPETKRNAKGLLADMRISLGMVARSYKGDASGARHRSATSVIEGVTRAARANEQMEIALSGRNGKAIAEATGNLSRAIGDLQTRYALTPAQNAEAEKGMRYLNAAWRSYSSRYVLGKSGGKAGKVDQAQVRALRRKVNTLEKRVGALEDQVATNAALRRQVTRLRQDLAYYDSRPDDYLTYQAMLLTLSTVSGSFEALIYTTRVYYPTYYTYFEPVGPDFHAWRSYWDGYYDGYYDGRDSVWYDEPVVINDPIIVIQEVDNSTQITYQTIYNTADEVRVEYEALPQENLTAVEIPAAPQDTVFTTNTMIHIEQENVSLDAAEAAREPEPRESNATVPFDDEERPEAAQARDNNIADEKANAPERDDDLIEKTEAPKQDSDSRDDDEESREHIAPTERSSEQDDNSRLEIQDRQYTQKCEDNSANC
ncbi:hypothetical protein [Rhizobium sp. BR 314]|uniref:hypothetical protein n=1 Tax=Rhizobium sp. BR 314 TaxID=3040013 RepID=UPI0039BFE151